MNLVPEAIGALLYRCAKSKAFNGGFSLHAAVIKMGFESDIVVSNHVVNVYAKCGNMMFARKVFDEMPERNLVSWSAMISGYEQGGEPLMAMELFSIMQFRANEFVFPIAISACASLGVAVRGQQIHAHAIKVGYALVSFVSNSLISMYMKCGFFSDALSVHETSLEASCVSYTALITGFVRNGQPENGLEVFKLMHQQGLVPEMLERNLVSRSAMISGNDQGGERLMEMELSSQMQLRPNEFVFSSAISACASLRVVMQGQQIHALAVKDGYAPVSSASNSLISMYMKCGFCGHALSVHETSLEPSCVSYNAVITGFVENGEPDNGFKVFKLMRRQGLVPNHLSFVGALSCCIELDLWRGIVLHCQTVKLNFDRTCIVGNMIITIYSKFNLIDDAEKAFKLIKEKDILSWNTIIASCSHCTDHAKGLRYFKEMIDEFTVRPDDFTIASGLTACAGFASMHHGKQIHSHLIRTRLHQDVGVSNTLMNMYAKCGCIQYADDIFNRMQHPNLVSYNTIIAGFGNHGLGEKAIELFEQMNKSGLNPDSVTFLGILTACNHAGLVDKGYNYFNSMKETYGIAPTIEHFSCFIDMLGRAGRLVEAEEYITKFPFNQHKITLGSLLSSCRLHGEVEIGKRIAKQLVKLQPVTSSLYVLLSNLYATDEMWDNVAEARKMLKGCGNKEGGHSLIEVKADTISKYIDEEIL